MRIRSLLIAALVAFPALASAAPVLQAGELSVGAEVIPSEFVWGVGNGFEFESDRRATPSAGFNVRYAFNQQLALIGTLGFNFTTVADDQDDPPASYALGVAGQVNFYESRRAAFLFKGGLQFIPRLDRDNRGREDQELGVRLYAGPGVEGRVTDALSIQFYTSLMDLQLGADTRFDITIVPTVGMFLYF